MKCFILTVILFFSVLIHRAQPTIEWQKSFGGSNHDFATSIQQTTDGGFIVAGSAQSNDGDITVNHGGEDCWIVKLTKTGVIDWQKSLGGSHNDRATSIQQTTDGGYIVAGYSNSNDGDITDNHGGSDYWVVKLSSTGVIDWQKSLGGSNDDLAFSIQQTTDGGYIVVGNTLSNDGDVARKYGNIDFWMVKLSSTGVIDWQKSIGGMKTYEASHVQQTQDGGYIVTGYSNPSSGRAQFSNYVDYWVVKLTATGDIDWQKSLGGTRRDFAESIQQTLDGGYIVAGHSNSTDGDIAYGTVSGDYWIVKLNNNGSIDWEESIGGLGNDRATSIQQTLDGGYIVTGSSTSIDGDITNNQGKGDFWVVKLTNAGIIDWQKSLGGTDSDFSVSIQQTMDKGYIVAGYTSSNDGDVAGSNGKTDYWIVKLSAVVKQEDYIEEGINLLPNPTKGKFTIEVGNMPYDSPLQILNSVGQLVYQTDLKTNQNQVRKTIELDENPGVYLIRLDIREKSYFEKLIVR